MNDPVIKLPWDMPTRERKAYELIAAKPPEERPPLEMLFKKYADLCFQAIADKDAVLERASKAEAQLSRQEARPLPVGEDFEEWWDRYLSNRSIAPFPDKASLWNAKQAAWSAWHAAKGTHDTPK